MYRFIPKFLCFKGFFIVNVREKFHCFKGLFIVNAREKQFLKLKIIFGNDWILQLDLRLSLYYQVPVV